MLWKTGEVVSPRSIVTELVTQEIIRNPETTRKGIAEDNLTLMRCIFGVDEVTLRGLQDQVGEVFAEATERAAEGRTDILALTCLLLGRNIPSTDNVHVVSWANQNGIGNYMAGGQRVASRLYNRMSPPWNKVNVGDIVIFKSKGHVYGVTTVENVSYAHIEQETHQGFVEQAALLRQDLAAMASNIPANEKLLVEDTQDSEEYWGGFAHFAEKDRKTDLLSCYATLVTFTPWKTFELICPVSQEAAGLPKIKFAMGKGYAASWYAGGPVVEMLANPEQLTWTVPQRRGRPKKEQQEATEE